MKWERRDRLLTRLFFVVCVLTPRDHSEVQTQSKVSKEKISHTFKQNWHRHFILTIIYGILLTVWFICIYKLHTHTQSKTTYSIIHLLPFFFFTTFWFWFHGFYTYKRSTTVSTAQYGDRGEKSFIIIIYFTVMSFLSTGAQRLRAAVEMCTRRSHV